MVGSQGRPTCGQQTGLLGSGQAWSAKIVSHPKIHDDIFRLLLAGAGQADNIEIQSMWQWARGVPFLVELGPPLGGGPDPTGNAHYPWDWDPPLGGVPIPQGMGLLVSITTAIGFRYSPLARPESLDGRRS